MNSSSSFRRERETRVLELLLVSPINEWQIILGRLRGLWTQFLPSLALLLGGWAYLAYSLSHFSSGPSILGMAVIGGLGWALIGTLRSLSRALLPWHREYGSTQAA